MLAIFIPTRPPADYGALMAKADAILSTEALRSDEALRTGPSEPVMHAMDEIHDRMESPADRMLRIAGARSNYLVLPLFAFANAGAVIERGVVAGAEPVMRAMRGAQGVGKPA